MKKLQDKVAVVTGGSRGIGAAISERLAADGARVVVNYTQDERAARAVVSRIEAAGGQALAIPADVRQLDALDRLVAQTVERWGAYRYPGQQRRRRRLRAARADR